MSNSVTVLHITTVPMTLMFLRGQAAFMRARGVELSALSSSGADLEAFGQNERVSVYATEMPRKISPLHDLAALLRIKKIMRSVAPVFVHAHTPKGGLLGMVAAWLCNVPVRIYHIHGLPFVTASGPMRLLLKATERISCLLAHRVLCVSHSVRDVAIREGLCRADKIAVLAGGSINGVDATARFNPANYAKAAIRARFSIPLNAGVVGFVGRLVQDKGIAELTRAWLELRSEFPELHLLIVGPFEPRDRVPQDISDALHNDPRVHLAGMEWETPPFYAAMDLVVLPSYREGFPVVPLEASAMGLPVVATQIPGCIDAVVDGVTGALVPPRDSRTLAAAIRRYMNDPELRRLHGTAGRERVLREFRQEVIWEAMHQEYYKLLRGNGLQGPFPAAAAEVATARVGVS